MMIQFRYKALAAILLVHLLACCGNYAALAAGPEQPQNDDSPSSATTTSTTTSTSPASGTTPKPSETTPPGPSSMSTSSSSSSSSTTTAKPTTTTANPDFACPAGCECSAYKVTCDGLKQVPKFSKSSAFRKFHFLNGEFASFDMKLLPMATITELRLEGNKIKQLEPPPLKKRDNIEMGKLLELTLIANEIEGKVANLTSYKMPNLEVLTLASNEKLLVNVSDFRTRVNLKTLDLCRALLVDKYDELTMFAQLDKLQHLNLSGIELMAGARPLSSLLSSDQLFAKNRALEVLDLSHNDLAEVPVALRRLTNLKKLLFDGNSIASLRPSDFINLISLKHVQVSQSNQLLRVEPNTFGEQRNLKTLIISQNEKFFDFSPDALASQANNISDTTPTTLDLLDLSGNNLTTLATPNFKTKALKLADNPWDCSCQLEWFLKRPEVTTGGPPIHCKTPAKFRDMEISRYFQSNECLPEEEGESLLQRNVAILFILFLILLTVAVFVQKTDLCRRLTWRDQYGTIYYTKASFPSEQTQ